MYAYEIRVQTITRAGQRIFRDNYTTIPSSICEDIEKGSRITFTATLEQSDDDESFAFAKRPTKASFVQEAA